MAGASFTSEELWAAVNFLIQANRHSDALHLFDEWRSISPSLSSPSNLSKMAQLLASAGAVAEASAIVAAIANTGLGPPPVSVYNAMIRALGKKKMFDELSKLVKTMRSGGPQPDAATFNLLIMIFAQGRLLRKMEEAHRTVLSRKMYLLPGSVAAMVEAYAELDRVSDMEKMYRRLLAYPVFQLQDDLIRKIAMAYIRNYKFSGLEELGNDVAARAGRSYVVWLLLLLGSGLFLSRRGMASVEREMGSAMVGSDISFVNIMALAHAKMKGFRDLEDLLLGFGKDGILKPDLITVGVVFDACSCGFDAGRVIDVWRRRGFLERKVVLETDPLVVAGFGKGNFVQNSASGCHGYTNSSL
ncbi:pentatricopeptide repeat-containing protein At3g42630-like [Wolffia australiana]